MSLDLKDAMCIVGNIAPATSFIITTNLLVYRSRKKVRRIQFANDISDSQKWEGEILKISKDKAYEN